MVLLNLSRALWRSWAQKPFCVPHFFFFPHFLIAGNELHSASMTFPEFQQLQQLGRFKKVLIREARGCRDRGETVKKQLGEGPGSPSRDIHNNIFELFCRYWNPHQMGEVTLCYPWACWPQTGWNQKADDADSHLPHHQPIRRMSMSWSHPLWIIIIQLLTTHSRLVHAILGALAHRGTLCLAKQ